MGRHLGGALAVSLALVALGCPSSGADTSTPAGACASYVAALRESATSCGKLSIAPSRQDEYFARYEKICANALGAPGSGLTPSILDQCTAKTRAACGDDEACGDLTRDLKGSLPDGAACDLDYQCASGECVTGDSQSGTGCGKCAPAVAIGQPCANGAGCVEGATCRSTSSGGTPTCVAVRIANAGETCSDPAKPEEAVRCADGLACVRTSPTSAGTCRAPVGEGEACGQEGLGNRCKPGLACIAGKCGKLLGAGAACTSSGECGSGLACDAVAKTCAAITWAKAGEACDDALKRCERGFCKRTSGAPGVCVDPIPDGAACDASKSNEQRCDSLARCVNGTCQLQDPARCK